MDEDMTLGEQVERLARDDERRKVLAIATSEGLEAVIKYLEEQLKK